MGKEKITGEEEITKIIILKWFRKPNKFRVAKEIDMEALELTQICKRVCFDYKDPKALIFVTKAEMMRYDYIAEKRTIVYKFQEPPPPEPGEQVDSEDLIGGFADQPEFFLFNEDQTACIITTFSDTLMINLVDKKEFDLDRYFGIADIKNVVFFNDIFYILANRRAGIAGCPDGKIGYFILKLSERNPLRDVPNPDDPDDK